MVRICAFCGNEVPIESNEATGREGAEVNAVWQHLKDCAARIADPEYDWDDMKGWEDDTILEYAPEAGPEKEFMVDVSVCAERYTRGFRQRARSDAEAQRLVNERASAQLSLMGKPLHPMAATGWKLVKKGKLEFRTDAVKELK